MPRITATRHTSGLRPRSIPAAQEEFILVVDELSREKGALTLLRAYESLTSKRPLLLVGRREVR